MASRKSARHKKRVRSRSGTGQQGVSEESVEKSAVLTWGLTKKSQQKRESVGEREDSAMDQQDISRQSAVNSKYEIGEGQ